MRLILPTKKTQQKHVKSLVLPTTLRGGNDVPILQMGKLRLQGIQKLDYMAPGLVICLFALTSILQPSSALLAVQTIKWRS